LVSWEGGFARDSGVVRPTRRKANSSGGNVAELSVPVDSATSLERRPAGVSVDAAQIVSPTAPHTGQVGDEGSDSGPLSEEFQRWPRGQLKVCTTSNSSHGG